MYVYEEKQKFFKSKSIQIFDKLRNGQNKPSLIGIKLPTE